MTKLKNVNVDFLNESARASIGLSFSRDVISAIDNSRYIAFPGFCDVHVHFREPGFSYKETIKSGSLAAARGGFPDFNEVHMGILLTGFAHTLFSGFAFVNLFLIPFGRYLGHLITVIFLSVSTVIPAITLLLLCVL